MATATIYPSASVPLYDLHRNDFVNQNYQVPIKDGFSMGPEESLSYPLSLNEVSAPTFPYPLPFQQPNNLSYYQPQMGLPQTFPTNGVMYNGGMASTFQPYTGLSHYPTPASSFTTASSLASSSSMSLQYGLTPSPLPLRKEVQKANPKSKSKGKRDTAQFIKRKLLIGKPKRKRGPNKRPPGTAFSSLLDGLPDEVKDALDQDYKGCCETVNTKDVSTKQKHVFSNRHCKNLPEEYREQVPNFVCPAFVAFKSNCRAKAGRYDSTDRHCKNCVGFDQINKGNKGALPVVITRAQYNAVQAYRNTLAAREGQKQATDQSTEEADNLVRSTILADIFNDRIPDWFPDFNQESESGDSVAIMDTTAHLPTDTASVPSVPAANHVEQPSLHDPSLFDPESANECAEAFKNGFPVINHEGESNVSDAIVDANAQPYTLSVPDLVVNHSEQRPSFCVPPRALFNPENVANWDLSDLLQI